MSTIRSHISISADGYGAGPNQSPENPLGEGGEALHDWVIVTAAWRRAHGRDGGEDNADSKLVDAMQSGIGAVIMGRNMFGGGPGEWDESWKGWWGDEPPFHTPVFVLTNHPRDPLEMQGGTTFHFVTDGIEAALEQAKAAAGDNAVLVAGGPSTINQYLAAGLLEELTVHVAPIVLGGGA
jgi:dihydrofolate reductase